MHIDDETAQVLDALVPHVAFEGWTSRALTLALTELARDPAEGELIFAGSGEMIEAYFSLADSRMIETAQEAGLEAERLTARVRAVVALRLEQDLGDKEAIRRALAWLSLPLQAPRLARIMAATTDSIWYAAGDKSADFSWYTKRASLGAVYVATLLYWLNDTSPGAENTLAFLDRRLAGIGRIGKLRHEITGRLCNLVPGRLRQGFTPQ
jgi:ubiquinone biosynthesis protein COQ9